MYTLASHLQQLTWEKEKQNGCFETLSGTVPSPPTAPSPPTSPRHSQTPEPVVSVGRYVIPASSLEPGDPATTRCLDSATGEHLSCRTYNLKFFQSKMSLFSAGSGTRGVHPTKEVLLGRNRVLVVNKLTYGDLHQYLRERKRLTEVQAAPLFRQIVTLVRDAHSRGIALRDIKLKKFVFEDELRTQLSLHYLDDAQLMGPSGQLVDRHGCPAYVCPEMLQPGSYSGQAADLWSLGIILYTLLVGHYPFFDSSTQNLFTKVRSGYYQIPDHVSALGHSLISSLLEYEPSQRTPAWAILEHPWFKCTADASFTAVSLPSPFPKDQMVPN